MDRICNILIHEFYDYHNLYKADELLKRKTMQVIS